MSLTEKIVKELKKFVATISIITILLAILSWWRGRILPAKFFCSCAFLLILLSLINIRLILPVYRIWMKGAEKLGIIMNTLILSILFYVILTPIGLILRLIGKDILKRNLERESSSYWLKREDGAFAPIQMERRY